MALTEDSVVDSIDVLLDGQIQVRTANRVFRDGVEISKAFSRHIVEPGMNLDNEDPRVKAVGQALHTPEVIAAFRESHPEIA